MNTLCQAKHKKHDRLLVDTQQGEMYVYDYDQYNGFNGYCTGQDDISRTLQNTGVWEPIETAIIKEILENGDRNASVIDFGTHIGWFTLMAAEAGYKVIGYEGDIENAETLLLNLKHHSVDDQVTIRQKWISPELEPLEMQDVELLKIDIEGSERFAIDACRDLFLQKKINHALIEISPTFNDTYPALVDFILSCGYKAFDTGKNMAEFDGLYNFPQTNFLFKRQ